MTLKITPTDDTREDEGNWTEYLGVKLKIARSTKPKYIADIARRMKVFKQGRRAEMDPDQVIDETCKALAKYILLDWKDFVLGDTEVKYSRESAYELLKNDPDCRDFVVDYADEAANYYKEEAEETVGKS